MTISLKNESPVPAAYALPLWTRYADAAASDQGRIPPHGSFSSILTDVLAGAGKEENLPPQAAALHEELLRRLLVKLKERMDSHLLRAAMDEGNDDDRHAFPETALPLRLSSSPVLNTPSAICRPLLPKSDGAAIPAGLEGIIERAANAYGVDRALIASVIRAESNFVTTSVSPQGARGLMQLMPRTARELGVKDAFDPVENVMGGTRYLKELLDRYQGDVQLALAAYNWGMGNVEKNTERLPRETSTYISRVIQFYREAKA